MSSPISTGSNPKALMPGMKKWYGDGYYGDLPEEFSKIFKVEKSEQYMEEEGELEGFGMMQVKDEGAPITFSGQKQGPITRYTHVEYALGIMNTYYEKINNLYEKYLMQRSRYLGFSKRQTKETVAANVLNRAHTSGYTGGDGSVLCATDHATLDGTQSNRLSTAVDISNTAVEDLWVQIAGATDSAGGPVPIMPEKLIVPRQIFFDAKRIVGSENQSGNANNDINVLRSEGSFPQGVMMSHYMTGASDFFVKTNCPDGMKCYERYNINLRTSNDFHTMNEMLATHWCGSFYWTNWRSMYSNGGGG